MYGVMSYSHFCDANSAVQTTSDENTSQSPDFACWRWMNWLRCSSADAGNSTSLAVRPWDEYFLLKRSIISWALPAVSLPWQYVTVPLAPSIALGSMTLAPDVEPLSDVLAAASAAAAAVIAAAADSHDARKRRAQQQRDETVPSHA